MKSQKNIEKDIKLGGIKMENQTKRKEILEKALQCVNGKREEQYGSPEDNFAMIAQFWELYLRNREDICISPEDVAVMMILLKIARIAGGGYKLDNWVDIAGYAACGGGICENNVKIKTYFNEIRKKMFDEYFSENFVDDDTIE